MKVKNPQVISFVIANTDHGTMLVSRLDFAHEPHTMGVGAQLFGQSQYEMKEVNTLMSLLDLRRKHFGDGVVMIDGGANIGVITVEASRFMRGWGEVIAFEPQERMFYALCGNIALQNCWNARAHQAALDSASGRVNIPEMDYTLPGQYGGFELPDSVGYREPIGQDIDYSNPTAHVEKVMIDSMGLGRLDLLKLDIEGMELRALEGAVQTIERCKPLLVVESFKVGETKLREFLEGLGYRGVQMGINMLAFPNDAAYVRDRPVAYDGVKDFDKAVAWAQEGESAKALQVFDRVIAEQPNNFLAHMNRGATLMQIGNYASALVDFQKIIDVGPHEWRPRALAHKGFCRVALGDLRGGFEDMENRPTAPPPLLEGKTKWEGGPLEGKTIIVLGEAGFGDTIMFSRYLKELYARGANIVTAVSPEVEPLIACLPYVTQYRPGVEFDCWVWMMSLAHLFETAIDKVPSPTEFDLPRALLHKYRKDSNGDRIRVGLCWSGSRNDRYDVRRNIRFAQLAPLFDVPNVDFYDLQVELRDEDREDVLNSPIKSAGPLASFLDTAALIRSLDLVITVDTAVAHVAGTVGVPTWVLLTSFRTYWMWQPDRFDCVWYPSISIYKQGKDGDWSGAIAVAVRDLRRIAKDDMRKSYELGEAGRTDEALAIVDKILADQPENDLAWLNRGTLNMQRNAYEDAIINYTKVIEAADVPGHDDAKEMLDFAKFSRGFANLKLGRLREGFKEFEHRLVQKDLPPLITSRPMLTQDDVSHNRRKRETVIVVGEMGFGDNVMFARYLPMLSDAGLHTMVTVPPQLATLMGCMPQIQVYGEHSPPFDAWVRIMSLAHVFDTDIDSVPRPAKFHVPERHLARWKAGTLVVSDGRKLKVGLCWSGGRRSLYDVHRSVPLAQLIPLFDIPGVDFYSLVMDVRESDLPAYDTLPIFGMADKIKDFLDTAAAISSLDLIITVDTATAHLAGSLGVPTWVMLTSFRTYWMWIHGREDSPWYPAARCFRQSIDGQWGDVVERIAAELARFRDDRRGSWSEPSATSSHSQKLISPAP